MRSATRRGCRRPSPSRRPARERRPAGMTVPPSGHCPARPHRPHPTGLAPAGRAEGTKRCRAGRSRDARIGMRPAGRIDPGRGPRGPGPDRPSLADFRPLSVVRCWVPGRSRPGRTAAPCRPAALMIRDRRGRFGAGLRTRPPPPDNTYGDMSLPGSGDFAQLFWKKMEKTLSLYRQELRRKIAESRRRCVQVFANLTHTIYRGGCFFSPASARHPHPTMA
jgi:hypothetical protein